MPPFWDSTFFDFNFHFDVPKLPQECVMRQHTVNIELEEPSNNIKLHYGICSSCIPYKVLLRTIRTIQIVD